MDRGPEEAAALVQTPMKDRQNKNRIRREIRDHFNAMLFPNEAEKLNDILFEEFNVQ